MADWLTSFHFIRPWWLLLLIVPLLFYGRYFHGKSNQSSWEKVCDKKLLDFLLIRGSSSQRKIMAWLAFLGLICAIIAAAGPSWKKIEIPSLAPENPAIMLLNLSSEMRGQDLAPNRLARAKFKIKDLLSALKGVQSGLIVYSSEPFLISPLTDDSKIIDNLLPAINYNIMPANGDRLDRAIALAIEKFHNAGYQKGEIIVFSPDVGQRFDLALEEAKKARQQNFTVNVIATSAKPVEKLKLIAEAGGGSYYNLSGNDEDIKAIAAKLTKQASELKESKNWQSVWLDYGYYLLVLPMLCCLYFFRKGILVLVFICCAHSAQASFFLNNNQEGLRDFEQQDYQRASEKFKDHRWKGSALYRMGDYEQAYQQFIAGKDVTSLYNQGNALAKGGKTPEAIKKYEEVLKIEPNHEDAKFNLEYLKQQQKQQQQPNQKDQQKQDKDKDKQEQDKQKQQQNNQEQQKDSDQEQKQQAQDKQQGQDDNKSNQEPPKPEEQPAQNQPQEQNQDEQAANPDQPKMNPEEQPQAENQPQPEPQKAQGGALQKEDKAPEYDEEVQARAQQYREIPEDPGGLLKAIIRKEYNRNRYNEKQ